MANSEGRHVITVRYSIVQCTEDSIDNSTRNQWAITAWDTLVILANSALRTEREAADYGDQPGRDAQKGNRGRTEPSSALPTGKSD